VKVVRTALELHSAHHFTGSQGCIAVIGGPEVWEEFMHNLHHIIDEAGQVMFTLEGNPEAAPPASEPIPVATSHDEAPRKRALHRGDNRVALGGG
jgi:hypothetical protein